MPVVLTLTNRYTLHTPVLLEDADWKLVHQCAVRHGWASPWQDIFPKEGPPAILETPAAQNFVEALKEWLSSDTEHLSSASEGAVFPALQEQRTLLSHEQRSVIETVVKLLEGQIPSGFSVLMLPALPASQ